VGYGFKISIVTIRPQIGVGSALLLGTLPSTSALYLEPGVTGLVSFGHLFVGIDANVAIFPNRSGAASRQADRPLRRGPTRSRFTVGVRF
jgi:hypothetical protein